MLKMRDQARIPESFFQRRHRRRLGMEKELHRPLYHDALILPHRIYFSRPADGETDARAEWRMTVIVNHIDYTTSIVTCHNDIQSTLAQVIAWCCQATSHCLGQLWLGCLTPQVVTRALLRPSYLHNRIPYIGKTTSLYWISAQSAMS